MTSPEELERQGWHALATSGEAARAFYEWVLDERPVMLLPGGMVLDQRAAMIDAMSGAPWSNFRLEDVRALPLTPDVVAVLYGVEADRDGTRYSALVSSTYVRRGGAWKLALHQQTPR